MDSNVVECERETGRSRELCPCRSGAGASLSVLGEVQRAYEERLDLIDRVGGTKKLQMQVEVLRSWVGDLVGQNTLLARAVQELETEATSRLIAERNKHVEASEKIGTGRCAAECATRHHQEQAQMIQTSKWPHNCREIISINEALQKENIAKEREIRRLQKDVQKYEQTVQNLRTEISTHNYRNTTNAECSKKDAEVMVGMCCAEAKCGVLDAAAHSSPVTEDVERYQERIHTMEKSLECSGNNVRSLRKTNHKLSSELRALRNICVALDEKCHAATSGIVLREDIILEMARQLKQAKAKIKENEVTGYRTQHEYGAGEMPGLSRSLEEVALCVQPRRSAPGLHRQPSPGCPGAPPAAGCPGAPRSRAPLDLPLHPESDDSHSLRLDGSGDDACQATSTPSSKNVATEVQSPDVSIIERTCSSPILISVESIEDLENSFLTQIQDQCPSHSVCPAKPSPRLKLVPPSQSPETSMDCLPKENPPNPQCPSVTIDSPCLSYLEELANSFQRPRSPRLKCPEPFHSDRPSPRGTNISLSPCPSPQGSCFRSPDPPDHDSPCPSLPPICPSIQRPKSPRTSEACQTSPQEVAPLGVKPCQPSDFSCPRPCLVKTEQTSVATTLKDLVSKIASFASQAPEVTSEDCSCGKDGPLKRCVQFKRCDDPRGVEELYFNQELKKSDVSVECDLCTEKECRKPSAVCINMKDEQTEYCSPEHQIQESGAGSSLAGSGSGGACDAARAQYYHSKLLATLQILQNKEETVRVQAASLAVAEQRIATLSARGARLSRELERGAHEIRALRKSAGTPLNIHKSDVSIETESMSQEVQTQKNMVKTLQNNLYVIEELYRECFYETAKQENLIETLRKSYLDVRLMEKQKADQIGSLHNVVNTQKWSLEQCQDVAIEVENLKLEITNFLNNSNNDSGMWEESAVGDVGEDLHDIMRQLLQLREVLQNDCSCGLREENEKLKDRNQALQRQLREENERTVDTERVVMERDEAIKQYKRNIDETSEQMESMTQELTALQKREQERSHDYEYLKLQLQQTQAALVEKSAELGTVQQRCAEQDELIKELRVDVEKADQIIKENSVVRAEVSFLSREVSEWRRQLAAAEQRAACRRLRDCDREKTEALQQQLEEARARGAALCAEASQVSAAVRLWLRRMKDTHSKLEQTIKEREATIATLQQRLHERPSLRVEKGTCGNFLSQVDGAPLASRYARGALCASPTTESEESDRSPSRVGVSEPASCRCSRAASVLRARERETASCSSAPTPPRRMQDSCKRSINLMRCAAREVSVQQPVRADAATALSYHAPRRHTAYTDRPLRAASPTEALCKRVDRLSAALADGQRRWSKHSLQRHT